MFGYETNQKQINKLETKVTELRHTVDGGLFGIGLTSDVKELKNSINNLFARMSILEEIVRESGLITDFDADEVKVREDRSISFGGIYKKQVPYQINKVKTVG